jgi:hypothetical protein
MGIFGFALAQKRTDRKKVYGHLFLSPEDQEQLMNVSSAYLEWKQKTLQEGRQEAAREILLGQLTRKFGSLDVQVVSQIQAITAAEKLKQLAEALIDAPDLQSFLQNL